MSGRPPATTDLSAMGGVAKMPAGLCWLLLLGVVLTFGVAASPAQASRANHYDFFVSPSIYYYANILFFFEGSAIYII